MSAPTRKEFLASSITPVNHSPKDKDCPICYRDYNTTTHTAVTFSDPASCNHIFGETCIVTWLTTNEANTCPSCRRKVFVLDEEQQSDADSGYDSEDDRDFESDYDSEEEDERDDEDDNIPLSWLYRDSLDTIVPDKGLIPLLETTWYKTWNLLSKYQAEIEDAYRHGPFPYNRSYFDRFLPTMPTLLGSFLDTVAARVGDDISGQLSEQKMDVLEALLTDMVEKQKGFVGVGEKKSGGFVPEFPRDWEPLCGWLVSVNVAVASTS